jgi:hypothetical protein
MRLVLFQDERHCGPGARQYLILRMAPGVAKPQRGCARPYIVNPWASLIKLAGSSDGDGIAADLSGDFNRRALA